MLPTIISLSRASKAGQIQDVSSLKDIRTCLWYSAAGGHFHLVKHYTNLWDTTLAKYDDKIEVLKKELKLAYLDDPDEAEFHIWDGGLDFAARSGDENIVDFFIDRGATNWSNGLNGAAMGGHLKLVRDFIERGATNFEEAASTAAGKGHQEIVDVFFDEYEVEDLDEIFPWACMSGNIDLVKSIMARGKVDLEWGLSPAAESGNVELFEWLYKMLPERPEMSLGEIVDEVSDQMGDINLDASISSLLNFRMPDMSKFSGMFTNQWDTYTADGARGGHFPMVHYCIGKGAIKFGSAIYAAAVGGYQDIVHFLISAAGNVTHDWNYYLVAALNRAHLELAQYFISQILDIENPEAIVRLLIVDKNDKSYSYGILYPSVDRRILINFLLYIGFTNWNRALVAAAANKDFDLVTLVADQGANNFEEAREKITFEDYDIYDYLLDRVVYG